MEAANNQKSKKMFKTDKSCIVIKNSRLYVVSTEHKDYSPRAVQIVDGFQIELGRSIEDFKEAIKYTRLPLMIKLLIDKNTMQQYQVIRMHTGQVEDKVIATLLCQHSIIKAVQFNNELVRDMEYRKYNKISIYHQLVIPRELNGASSRSEQVRGIMSMVTRGTQVKVEEMQGIQIIVYCDLDGQALKFLFITNKESGGNFTLASITLLSTLGLNQYIYIYRNKKERKMNMGIGLNIGDGIRVELGGIKEVFINELDKRKIRYTIPYDKTNNHNIKETIIQIDDLGMEVSIENDIITYIKSNNNEYTNLDTIDDMSNILGHIKTIKEHIENRFGEGYTVSIEKIDSATLSIVVILTSQYERARAIVVRDGHGNIYINTLRAL